MEVRLPIHRLLDPSLTASVRKLRDDIGLEARH